jgi:hypothetical protein
VVGVRIGVFEEGVTVVIDAVEAAAGVAGVGATSSRLLRSEELGCSVVLNLV